MGWTLTTIYSCRTWRELAGKILCVGLLCGNRKLVGRTYQQIQYLCLYAWSGWRTNNVWTHWKYECSSERQRKRWCKPVRKPCFPVWLPQRPSVWWSEWKRHCYKEIKTAEITSGYNSRSRKTEETRYLYQSTIRRGQQCETKIRNWNKPSNGGKRNYCLQRISRKNRYCSTWIVCPILYKIILRSSWVLACRVFKVKNVASRKFPQIPQYFQSKNCACILCASQYVW